MGQGGEDKDRREVTDMNKTEFTNELRELSQFMTEEQIEMAITALNGCRQAINKKKNQNREGISRLLDTFERNEAEFSFTKAGSNVNASPGKVRVLGASLLTRKDFYEYGANIPKQRFFWWLYDGGIAKDSSFPSWESGKSAFIRPVLIISDEDASGLNTGDDFYISTERFRMISASIAIKTVCLQDSCTFTAEDYESSMIKCCVEGWYARLMRSNKLWEEKGGA